MFEEITDNLPFRGGGRYCGSRGGRRRKTRSRKGCERSGEGSLCVVRDHEGRTGQAGGYEAGCRAVLNADLEGHFRQAAEPCGVDFGLRGASISHPVRPTAGERERAYSV